MFTKFQKLTRKTAVFFAIIMVLSLVSIPAAFAADAVQVANWDYSVAPTAAAVPATSGILSTGAVLTNFRDLTPTASSGGLCISGGWNSGTGYWQLSLSTLGYENLILNAKTRSSATGPRDFKVTYSTDNGATWTGVTSNNIDYAILSTTLTSIPTLTLPASTANVSNLLIRFTMASNISSRAGTGTYPATETVGSGGTSNINNIHITGTPAASTSVVGAVAAVPGSGAVAAGSKVALSCDTEGATIMYSFNDGAYAPYDPVAQVTLETLPVTLKAYGTKSGMTDGAIASWNFTQAKTAAVTASPNGGSVKLNSQVALACATPGASIKYSLDGGTTFNDYSAPITLATLPATISAFASATGMTDSTTSTYDFTLRTSNYSLYFGQLHSHTTNSDGIGTLSDAYSHAKNVAKVDFLAVTDHSNSLETTVTASMADGSSSAKWVAGHTAADVFTDSSFVGIYAFEMTWSNGTGHINTFNTPGFENRANTVYTATDGLQKYYNVLKNFPDSISQFNHPGTTFGDFNDFANYDPTIDQRISLVEVGNGEGAIGSSGYFPSYAYYTRALDKGWHLAPTNNQDNHLGNWGDANTARTVVLADSLTRDNIYDAMRNMRVYATEDNNLRIKYTLNGEDMGTILDQKPGNVDIKIDLQDPDNEALGKVSVISNGGRVVASRTITASQDSIEFNLSPDYSYYYVRVDEADKDIAVTAPVWIADVEKAGIAQTTSSTALPLKGKSLTIKTDLYNNESAAMSINSLEYSIGGSVIHTASAISPVASLGTGSYSFDYTPAAAGKFNIDVKLIATINGVEKTFTNVLKLNVVDPAITTKIVVDASHYNDYVTGYYSGNMTNLVAIANAEGINVVLQTSPLTDSVLADAQLLVLSPPAKKAGTAGGTAYPASPYTTAEIAAITNYANNGGNIIITSLADYQDSRTDVTLHSAYQQNLILAAIGAGTRINDDEVVDYDNNPNVVPPGVAGGTPYRVPMNAYNTASQYLDGVDAKQNYSFYSGCSITMGSGATWLVKGTPTTYGFDSDNDTLGGSYVSAANKTIPADTGIGKGNVVALATETLPGGGKLFAGGTVFYSNFEVKATLDNYGQLQNSNYNILMNILDSIKKVIPVTHIQQVRAGTAGDTFCVEGTVTAGKTPSDNAFFDTIYVQDATGGLDIFPVSGTDIQIGQKVKVTGTLDQYQGDPELRVIELTVTDTTINPAAPTIFSTGAAMASSNGGWLVKVQGVLKRMDSQNLYINDGSGEARVFVDGYIGDGSGDSSKLGKWDPQIKVGDIVSAIGLASVDTTGPRLRVRNTAEIVREAAYAPVGLNCQKTDVTIPGGTNGTITITASGGNSGSYNYSIDGGATWKDSNSFTGLAAGTYTVMVRDAGNTDNTASDSVTINNPTLVGLSCQKTDATLYGEANGTITVTASGGDSGSYNYSNDGGVTWQSSNSFTDVAAGTYTVVVRDAGNMNNTASDTVIVGQPTLAGTYAINKVPHSAVTCTAIKVTPVAPPSFFTLASVSYASSDPSTGFINNDGYLTFLKAGTVKITATEVFQYTIWGRAYTYTEKISRTITVQIMATSVTLNKDTVSIERNDSVKLVPSILPTATGKKVKWTSGNNKIATVSRSGVVEGKSVGTTTITCTVMDGSNAQASCTVTVTPILPTGIRLSDSSLKITKGKTYTLNALVLPRDADNKTVIWSSSDTSVVTVDAKGKVTAVSKGTAIITVTTVNGLSDKCVVTVK